MSFVEWTAEKIFFGIFLYIFATVILLPLSFFTTVAASSRTPTTAEVSSKAFGLENGKKYPFRYGRVISGSSGYAAASGGLFSSSAVVNLKPSSSMDISFSNGKNSYILELPFKNIKFIPTKEEKPSIRLYLNNVEYGYTDLDLQKRKTFQWKVVPHFGRPTKSLEETGWFKDLKEEGQLGPFVDDYFNSAVITLKPRDYARILGE